MKDKYLWYTDTHLDKLTPWTKFKFISHIVKEKPKGIFLTGDISNGFMTGFDLGLLARWADCPIYFVLGNHDYHFSSIQRTHDKIRNLCAKHKNLIWMTESDVVSLSPEVGLIGVEGWYDADVGDPKYLRWTIDWALTSDFRKLSSMNKRVEAFRQLADNSAKLITHKLEKAFEKDFKTVYILTHFPPWKEATRDVGTLMEKFWLPYNVNLRLGKAIEACMVDRKRRHATVLAGHTHTDCWIHVSRNIECKVNKAKYYGSERNEETIFI